MQPRRSKIVATLGPASAEPKMMEQLVVAGVDVARLNFSHGTVEEHRRNVENIREISDRVDRSVACMQDLSGPKIRTGPMAKAGGVDLTPGERFTITVDDAPGTAERVSTNYKKLNKDVTKGSRLLLDDGLIELSVQKVQGSDVVTEVVVGGVLKSNKGINLPGAILSIPPLTDKDRRDVVHGINLDVDFIAMSFVRRKEDIELLRAILTEHGRADIQIIAKIERPEGVDNLEEILEVADGVMVARGDLGVELATEQVPAVQKRIIRLANHRGRIVITATQMLDSMIRNPLPTRAEASDIANAILDGTDAIMLSAETATGLYPLEAVETMAKIAIYAERHMRETPLLQRHEDFPTLDGSPVARAVGIAARRAAEELNAKYIVAFTESGSTVRQVSHVRPICSIIGFTPSERVYRRLAMRWGVIPQRGEHFETTDAMLEVAMKFLKKSGFVKKEDVVVTICGTTTLAGATNMMKVVKF